MSTFYLIRHGATDFIGRALSGWTPNVHLNTEGQKQARTLADRLAHVQFHRVISSPLERTQETALPLAKQQGLQITIEHAVGEVNFGDWTGKPIAELSSDPDWKQWNTFRSGARIPNGETMSEIQGRTVLALLKLHQQFRGQTIAVFSHGDIIRAALLHFLGMPLDFVHRIEISPASYSILKLYDEAAQVLAMNVV